MNARYRIVIAEDNPADVMVVRMALEKAIDHFELKVFEDGDQILNYLVELENQRLLCPDVMLLDLNMPKAGGLEVMERLRRCGTCSSTPVIVITSSSHPKDRKEALALGAAHYFLKPDDFDEFLKIGDVVLGILKGRPEGASDAVGV
jgi:CheY-like chemotaxis protein